MLKVVSIVEREDERAVFFDIIRIYYFNQPELIICFLLMLKECYLVANIGGHIFCIKEISSVNRLLVWQRIL